MSATITVLRARPLLLLLAVLTVLAAAAVAVAAFHGAPVHWVPVPAHGISDAMTYNGKPGMTYN